MAKWVFGVTLAVALKWRQRMSLKRMARTLSPLEAHTRTFLHRSRWTPRPREWSSFNLPIQRVRASVTNNSSLLAQAAVVALVPL